MLNLAICLVCLVKLFVYGEPIVSESEMQEYYVYKKKADQLMAEVCAEFNNRPHSIVPSLESPE